MEISVGLAERGIPFDSIMVDASHADVSALQGERLCIDSVLMTPDRRGEHRHCQAVGPTFSCAICGDPLTRPSWIARCHAAGVATEVELGRLEGGEAGLRVVTGTVFTDPKKAEAFMKE